ncbi:response regulator transcription factor [Gracilinema caldarium]|uniref:Phosphate regulon transcriptional regulatory protein PhoB n=1 Tax=Gracilinema caldarium (strain ATCC 51460 / DSM 7334 / H1) TaxID=744872 RepID=F8EY42_GRAC1|nr:response regulator transcription factor [Gracilinema caldarium]AEJ20703.1 two component transcriptional regulator, winged helix family [Gracilinema caldarium DSM 7334]
MKNILIVEDDLNIAELERDFLKLNGYSADIETDGSAALKAALTGRYDVLIVDLMLPGTGGYDIIKAVREKYEIPILVVSARSEDIDKIRGFEFGADDYLTKPFSPAELAARVKSHIERYDRLQGGGSANVIIRKWLEIDTASHKVLVSGREVSLTSTEYDLLVFLASNPNIVFTKERLFEAVWGDSYSGDLATVPVHIQKIRHKIEKNPGSPELIETLWGTGYRFNG